MHTKLHVSYLGPKVGIRFGPHRLVSCHARRVTRWCDIPRIRQISLKHIVFSCVSLGDKTEIPIQTCWQKNYSPKATSPTRFISISSIHRLLLVRHSMMRAWHKRPETKCISPILFRTTHIPFHGEQTHPHKHT